MSKTNRPKHTEKRINGNSRSADENILTMYLKEISKISLLTREEEVELATRAREGDSDAKNRLVQANLRFVVNVAKKYQNQGLPLVDLISEGNIGLLNAIDRFDVDKGFHFISYAVWWIRQAILKAICEKSRMIRLPLNRANELVQIEKARKEMSGSMKENDDIRELAKVLNMGEDLVTNLLNISREYVSLDTPVYREKDSSVLSDFVEDTANALPEDVVLSDSLTDDINKILSTLSEKEAEIIQFRFGLNGYAPMSLKEIGARYNLTKERIRQIEKKAIKRLQHPTRSRYLSSYVE